MITFLILKYDIIESSRIELKEIVVPVQVGGLLGGGGGAKGYVGPPSQIIGGGLAPPLPMPMVTCHFGIPPVLRGEEGGRSSCDLYVYDHSSLGSFFLFSIGGKTFFASPPSLSHTHTHTHTHTSASQIKRNPK